MEMLIEYWQSTCISTFRLKTENELTEGEDFTVCFIEFIKTLISGLQHDLTLSCVSNIMVNSGLRHYL
jgi:hypothetical protein